MSLTITIAGVDKTSLVQTDTFNLTNALGQRDTFSTAILSPDASYCPPHGGTITVEHSTLGPMFGGIIYNRSLDLQKASGSIASLLSTIDCVSWEVLMDRRLCGARVWTAQTAGFIFQDIFSSWMGGEVLFSTIVATGPTIQSFSVDWCTVREAYDELVAAASVAASAAYAWDVTPDKITRFYSRGTYHAGIDVTETNDYIVRPITISNSFQAFANVTRVRVGNFVTDEQTQTFHPDGSTRSFGVDKPIAAVPTITLDGVAQSVGFRGAAGGTTSSVVYTYPLTGNPVSVHSLTIGSTVYSFAENGYSADQLAPVIAGLATADSQCSVTVLDATAGTVSIVATGAAVTVSGSDGNTTAALESATKQWYWQDGSATIEQDPSETIPSSTSELVVTFRGYQSTVVDTGVDQDSIDARVAAEGGTGYWMILLETSTGKSSADALSVAGSYLANHAKVPTVLNYRTDYAPIRAGMYQHVTLTSFGDPIDAEFIIESVSLVQQGDQWFWNVKAVDGALLGDWKTKLYEIASPGSSAPSSLPSGSSGASADQGFITINVPVDEDYAITETGNLIVNVTAATRDCLITLPLEASEKGDTIWLKHTSSSTFDIIRRVITGDDVDGNSSDYHITPTMGQWGGIGNS